MKIERICDVVFSIAMAAFLLGLGWWIVDQLEHLGTKLAWAALSVMVYVCVFWAVVGPKDKTEKDTPDAW